VVNGRAVCVADLRLCRRVQKRQRYLEPIDAGVGDVHRGGKRRGFFQVGVGRMGGQELGLH
jgi:hypothetical protein